jgi:dolichol kinase
MSGSAATAGRKSLHLATGLLPVAWSAGLLETTQIQIALGAAVAVAVVVEVARRSSAAAGTAFRRYVGPMLKPHEAWSLTGATWLAFAMLAAVLLFPPAGARTAMWAGAVGDASAALVGGAWGGRRAPHGKSIVGALACAVATAAGALWLGDLALPAAVAVGVVGAAAEWPARWGDDNTRVTLLVGAAAWVLVRG